MNNASDLEHKSPAAIRKSSRFCISRSIARGEKGLFDATQGVVRANRKLAESKVASSVSIQLVVAGNFINDEEKEEFDRIVDAPAKPRGQVRYLTAFVSNEVKQSALLARGFLLFPDLLSEPRENQPVNSDRSDGIPGLPILTTRCACRCLELLFRRVIVIWWTPGRPNKSADALLASVIDTSDESFRRNVSA